MVGRPYIATMERRLTPRSARLFRGTVRYGALIAATAYAVIGTANRFKFGFFTHSPSIGEAAGTATGWKILLPMMDNTEVCSAARLHVRVPGELPAVSGSKVICRPKRFSQCLSIWCRATSSKQAPARVSSHPRRVISRRRRRQLQER